ncbi:MAG: hypothetical protein EON57_09460 [Alphaproteobacteria bacterium]|nr:MAG: hypothetical protein EON57_09460 [Alphaproteobacteria bacterium]
MDSTFRRMGAALIVAALSVATATAAPPDLTGVWTNAGRPGIGGATGPGAQATPLKPEAKKRVEAYQALVAKSGDSPGGVCLGTGMPGSMLGSGGYPMEIIQRPEQITVIYEAHSETRRIYFGDRNAPQKDRVPGRNGYSEGKWEGDTLVVTTDNLVDQVDQRTTPHSDKATIVERYTLQGKDDQGRQILKAEMTLTDPVFYDKPLKMEKLWAKVPNGRLLPYECNEEFWNDRLEQLAEKAGVSLP